KLGLAEFSNGNFLGEDALYAEYFKLGDKHYFPYPKLSSTKGFQHFKGNLAANVVVSYLKDGSAINRIPIKKHTDGVVVDNHSVLLHLGTYTPNRRSNRQIARVASTIKDDKVLENYHAILIPKAIEYSAGILDYFFRGNL